MKGFEVWFCPKFLMFVSSTGKRGLEVRGDGPGPVVPVDLHHGGGGRHRGHHPAG